MLFATGTLGLDPGVQILGDGLGPDFMFTVDGNVGTVEFLAMDIGPVVDDDDMTPVADGDDIAGVSGPNLNRQRMASYLDDLCPRVESLSSPSSDEADLDQRCGNLRNVGTTSSQIMTALDAISPDDIINNVGSVLRFAPTQHGTLTRRLNGLRSGSSRINVTGLNIETENVRLEGEDLQKAMEALTDGEFGRWGFFSDGRMNFGTHEATDRVPGFDFDTISATVGTDYRVRPNAYLGAALSYNEADADFDAGGGTTLKTTTLSLFATYFRDSAFYADAMISYGMGDLDTARDVVYEDAGGILFRQARGSTDGEQLSAGAGTGFDFSSNQWVFGPHLGLYYSDFTLDAFEETGAGGLNFAFPEQNPKSFIANGGVHVSRSFNPGWGVFVPYARIDYVHEFDNSVEQTGCAAGQRPVCVRSQSDDWTGDRRRWRGSQLRRLGAGFSCGVHPRSSGVRGLSRHDQAAFVGLQRGYRRTSIRAEDVGVSGPRRKSGSLGSRFLPLERLFLVGLDH